MANLKDFATGTVATAPSPATSGTSLTLQTGEGALMPAVPFNAVAHPQGELPTLTNAEKILVTAITTDTLTITRAQGDSTAKSISTAWRVSNSIFAEDVPEMPASSIDNTIPRFNGITGRILQASGIVLNDDDDISTDGVIESTLALGSPLLVVDSIVEWYTDQGVTIDGVLLKDALVDGRNVSADGSKLDGIETGAEVNNISDANATDLTDAGDSALHFHSTDRARANHTGTQTMSTISDAGELATQSDTDILAKVYPVGSIYIATVATNPATLFGFGTWAAYGEGRVIVGKAGSGTFGTAGATGGAESVAGASHNHDLGSSGGVPFGLSGSKTHVNRNGPSGTYTVNNSESTTWGGASTASTTTSLGLTGRTNNATPSATSVLQPYIVAYMWERTA